MTRLATVLCLAAILSLNACAAPSPGQPHPYEGYLKQKNLELPNPEEFQHCRGYGCAIRDRVSMTNNEWKQAAKFFKKAKTPEQERAAISKAVGWFEENVGEKTGTSGDMPGTFGKVGKYQLDCVDESTNTTIYLSVLEQKKLLKFHKVSRPTSRSPLTGLAGGRFWPHFTAVIYDTTTGEPYAVDSWFRSNGRPADIVTMKEWLYGWGPDIAAVETQKE